MNELLGQAGIVREGLIALLTTHATALAREWVAAAGQTCACDDANRDDGDPCRQAEAFLRLLVDGLRLDGDDAALPRLPQSEGALQAEFPLVYRVSMLLALATLLAERMRAPGEAVLAVLQRAFAALPACPDRGRLFNERLGRLSQLSWMFNMQQDEDAIIALALQEARTLVGAASSAVWPWDADQQAPIMMVTAAEQVTDLRTPPALLEFFRQTCASGCAFSIDAGESDDGWPADLQQRPIAFIPLPAQEGCLGILTIHHRRGGRFSHDDILLLSSLGNLASTALRNVQLYTNERHLVKLLQSSIRQVVEATASRSIQHEEFVQSLLQVAEGLTRADAVCVVLEIEEAEAPLVAVSGSLVAVEREPVVALTRRLLARAALPDAPSAGLLLDAGVELERPELGRMHYAVAEILLGGKRAGVVAAVRDVPFTEDQAAFLGTMAEQIGVGVDNRQQSANLQRLLFELSNVNYVSEAITSTFDPHRIFTIISQAASQALRAPIALCGWLEEDGSIRVLPDTTVGVPPHIAAELSLTYNNTVMRTVLEQQTEVSSRALGRRAAAAFPTLRPLHVRDWVCVPMIVKPRARGVMLVADSRPREFSNREIALLSTYANQAALAMENSLLYEQVDQQLRQMEQLYQVTHSIGASLHLDAILEELLQAATTALSVPVALICLTDEESGTQQLVASSGIDPTPLRALRIDPGEEIIGVSAQRGEIIRSSFLMRDGRSPLLRDLARDEGLAASLTVPLQVQGRVLGTLTVISREARDYTPAHEQLLLAMATEAAVAVQNARLYGQERARAHELRQLITEVSGRVANTLDLLHDLLAIVQETEPTPAGIARTRGRLESIAAVQAGIADDDPTMVDMREALTSLAAMRSLQSAREGGHLDIRVTGAHLILPSRPAMALALLIHEWLQAAIAQRADDAHGQITVAFQQFSREVLVHVEDSADWHGAQAAVNHAIIEMVTRILPGTVTETCEGGMHRVRFRFSRS